MNERQRRARYEREMAALYQELDTLRRATGSPCPTCSRRERQERLERFHQGGGIDWEKLTADLPSMTSKARGAAR